MYTVRERARERARVSEREEESEREKERERERARERARESESESERERERERPPIRVSLAEGVSRGQLLPHTKKKNYPGIVGGGRQLRSTFAPHKKNKKKHLSGYRWRRASAAVNFCHTIPRKQSGIPPKARSLTMAGAQCSDLHARTSAVPIEMALEIACIYIYVCIHT